MYIPTMCQAPQWKAYCLHIHIVFEARVKEFKSRIYRNINVTDVKIVYSANGTNMYSENTYYYMRPINIFLA